MSSLVLKLIDRAEGSSVRGMIGPDGMQVFSVYDFLTVACGYGNSGASARNEFKRLTKDESEFKNEIVASCYSLRFPGQRGLLSSITKPPPHKRAHDRATQAKARRQRRSRGRRIPSHPTPLPPSRPVLLRLDEERALAGSIRRGAVLRLVLARVLHASLPQDLGHRHVHGAT